MRTEIVKIIQYLREGDQEKAESFAKQFEINAEKSKDPDQIRFANRVSDAVYGVFVDPDKTVCLDNQSATTISLNGKLVSDELKEKLFKKVRLPHHMKKMVKSGISTRPAQKDLNPQPIKPFKL